MKVLALETLCNEPENLEIQGLYPVKNSCQSYWSLLSKVELAIFQDHKEKGEKIE